VNSTKVTRLAFRVLSQAIKLIGKIFYKNQLVIFRSFVDQLYVTYVIDLKNNISENFYTSLIHAEDKRYYSHYGVDFIAVISALLDLILKDFLRGASTIEQQLVRVITGYTELRLRRKIKEAVFAIYLCSWVPKNDIIGIYLMIGHYGHKMYGIADVCEKLPINLQTATLFESALIIARLKYPEFENAGVNRMKQIYNRALHICVLVRKELNIIHNRKDRMSRLMAQIHRLLQYRLPANH
jgi:membrane carboxypeptidase/penicillin-binding protein